VALQTFDERGRLIRENEGRVDDDGFELPVEALGFSVLRATPPGSGEDADER